MFQMGLQNCRKCDIASMEMPGWALAEIYWVVTSRIHKNETEAAFFGIKRLIYA